MGPIIIKVLSAIYARLATLASIKTSFLLRHRFLNYYEEKNALFTV